MPTPEEIAHRRFLVSLRGYDRDQVQAFLEEISRHVSDLERRNAELAAQLEAARTDLAHAHDEVAAVRASDQQDNGAEDTAHRPFAALGEETQRVLEAAHEAAEAITRKARQDADRQLQASRQATAKVIAEGERRREQMEDEVTRLEERRNTLLQEVAGVGRAVENILSDLGRDGDAPTVREALSDPPARRPKPLVRTPRSAPRDRAASVAAMDETSTAGEAAATAVETADPETEAVAAPAEVDADGDASATVEEPPEVAVDDAPATGDAETGAGTVETAEEGTDAEVDAEPAPAGGEPGAAAVAEPSGTGAAAVAEPPETGAEGPEPEASEPERDTSTPLALRAAALEPLHPKFVRKLKRGLSDLHNMVLDRLRQRGDKAEAEGLAPEEDEMAILADLAQAFLDQAYEAGVGSAAVLAGRSIPAPKRYRSLEVDFAADGARRIKESLVTNLRIGLADNESISVLNDRIGTVFSELKSTAADELSALHLIRAYEYGLLDAWEGGGVTKRVWILGKELRCPEGRCRLNDETGAVDVTSPFPSGNEVPPVHVGCTCTAIPALET